MADFAKSGGKDMRKFPKLILAIIFVSIEILVSRSTIFAVCTNGSPGYCANSGACDAGEHCSGNSCCVPNNPPPPWTCFPAGTKVKMASGEERNIEEVAVGDEVVSQSESGNRSVSTVTKLDQPVRDHMCRLSFEDGDSLRLTNEHPLFTQDGWKAIAPGNTLKDNPTLVVGSLVIGDRVVKEDKSWSQVTNISCWSEKIQAYNLILDNGAHTYFADDYLAHNKNNCDPNIILGCNTCSAYCGGGTQQCLNECGDVSTRACNTQACCEVGPPTIRSINDSVINWTPGVKGTQQVLRVGTNYSEVTSGCPNGSSCVASPEFPAYVPGAMSGRLYFYLTTLNAANNPTGCLQTNSSYASEADCETSLALNLPGQTTGKCYPSLASCQMYNVDTYDVGTMPAGYYYWRVVNLAACSYLDDIAVSTVVDELPVGNHDSSSCSASIGWACDPSDYSVALQIHFYAVDPFGTNTFIGSTVANVAREAAIGTQCGGNSSHGFSFDMSSGPAWLRDGNSHTISAYAINIGQGSGNPLLGTPKSFTCPTITGFVYNDADNICSNTVPFSGQTVTLNSLTTPSTTTTAGDGSFSFVAPIASNTLDVSIPSGYTCSTGASGTGCGVTARCSNQPSVAAGSVGNNFFLTQSRGAWWQAEGAGVYAGSNAGGATVQSILPKASDRLILAGAGGTVGAVLHASGNVSTGSLGQVSDPMWVAKTKYGGATTDYAYFAKKLGIIDSMVPETKASGMSNGNDCTVVDGYCYVAATGTSGDWHVTTGQKYIVLVDGNFAINNNIIVDNGGFLAIIAKGDITVAASATLTQVQGLYVSENFITNAIGVPLEVQGSVVAWTGVSLGRDLGGAGNISNPAEKFIYRPDLLVNMPESMKSFVMQWQEVVPGTYGN